MSPDGLVHSLHLQVADSHYPQYLLSNKGRRKKMCILKYAKSCKNISKEIKHERIEIEKVKIERGKG